MIDQTKVQEYKKLFETLNIPPVYEKFPADFTLDINGWSFPDDQEKVFLEIQFDQGELNCFCKRFKPPPYRRVAFC